MNARLISILAVALASGVIAAEPVVAPQGFIGLQRAVIQKALGEPTTSGQFNGDIPVDYFAQHGVTALYDQLGAVYYLVLTEPKGGEPPELFGVTIASSFEDCVKVWGEPLTVTEDKAAGFFVPEWTLGKFNLSGEFWSEGSDGNKKAPPLAKWSQCGWLVMKGSPST